MSTDVLLMAYGGPTRLEDVPAYLLDVRGGRATPQAVTDEIAARYERIGGGSPILRLTRAQATALEQRVGRPVRVGMRHWFPYIHEAVAEARAAGTDRLIAIPMSPFYSRMSVGAYADKLREGLGTDMSAALIHSWHVFPAYLSALACKLAAARAGFETACVIFTAHSLPERLRRDGDPYDSQLRASAAAVAERSGVTEFDFAYQSPGKTPEPWMGPFVEDTMRERAAQGTRQFLVIPIGFVCDHVEILYDIDVVLADLAAELQVDLRRSESLNDDAGFIDALASLVEGALKNQHSDFVIDHIPSRP